jgi:hypothetical protein
MSSLIQEISQLSDAQAIKAASYFTGWMQEQLRQDGKLPIELENQITDDEAALLLGEEFKDLSNQIQQASLAASESQRGRIARNLLLVVGEDEIYKKKVQESLDQLLFATDPITVMAVAAGIVFFLSLEFKVECEEIEGKKKCQWELSRKATSTEVIKQILGLGDDSP